MANEPGATAVIFPGQGAQRPGMGVPWRETPAWDLVAEISGWTDTDVEHLLTAAAERELRRTDRAQLAVFTVGVLAYHEAVHAGVLTDVDIAGYAGHSLGEYVALYASGALGLREAAVLVAERGAAMLRAARRRPGAMAALIGKGVGDNGADQIVDQCRAAGHSVWVANHNGPGQAVISGTETGITAVADRAAAQGLRVVRLHVTGAFHTPLMESAAKPFRKLLQLAPFADISTPIAANVDGELHAAAAEWPDLMTAQITSPVRWDQCVRTLIEARHVTRFIELGPGRTLSGLTARIAPSATTHYAATPTEVAALAQVAV